MAQTEQEKTCCCRRKKHRSEEEVRKLIHRLNRIEGQIRGIRGMIEDEAYCVDILVQSAAATAAINAFNRELLAEHIRTCVAQDLREGRDETIEELVSTLQKLMR
ncbi:MAG: metal-sensing transcriptional repressor [Gemmiger sp.]|uniref:metal-sensing transcriptional repressor n=1 Tax=Gemmiger sp. TaxID=2049027 RepID=UPI002E77724A|nr:metal-sensing transcriptional repressor [Gemmiger sp.]MEE0800781.1 metal-sensing transcriptional repressor [Gemmiger sp.]